MKKKTEEVEQDSFGKELRHYYCHLCDMHHDKGSAMWIEHHPKLRKQRGIEKPVEEESGTEKTDNTGSY